MKTRFTPGPWTLYDLSKDNDPKKEKQTREWSLVHNGPIVYLKTEWGKRGDSNARLLELAPTMFEMLELCREIFAAETRGEFLKRPDKIAKGIDELLKKAAQ